VLDRQGIDPSGADVVVFKGVYEGERGAGGAFEKGRTRSEGERAARWGRKEGPKAIQVSGGPGRGGKGGTGVGERGGGGL